MYVSGVIGSEPINGEVQVFATDKRFLDDYLFMTHPFNNYPTHEPTHFAVPQEILTNNAAPDGLRNHLKEKVLYSPDNLSGIMSQLGSSKQSEALYKAVTHLSRVVSDHRINTVVSQLDEIRENYVPLGERTIQKYFKI